MVEMEDDGAATVSLQIQQAISRRSGYMTVNQWFVTSHGYFPAPRTSESLPTNIYEVVWSTDYGWGLKPRHLELDDVIVFENSVFDKVLDEVRRFWESDYSKYKMIRKRGYLLYGPPGCGKSYLALQIADDVVERGGLAIYCDSRRLIEGVMVLVRTIREVEPERKLVCILEDMDSLIDRSDQLPAVLSFLGGEGQVGNIIYVATANSLEVLDKRITCRPGRFDRIVTVDVPNEEMRRKFLMEKLGDDADIEQWVKVTEGFSMAALAELIVSVKCLGNSFEEALQEAKIVQQTMLKGAGFRV